MAENTTQTTEAEIVEPQSEETTPSRLQVFVNKHPRAAKVAAVTGAIGSVVGVVCFTKTVRSNRMHLEAAGDHAKEALSELSATVDPATPDPEA